MTDTTDLANLLIDAHLTAKRITPAPVNLTRDEIFEVQSAVCAALGDVAGFKVGRTQDADPIIAPIPARYLVTNGGARATADRLGVELEVGFEVIRALPSGGLPARPADYVRPCATLELVDTRLEGPLSADPAFKFADLQINAGLVVGVPMVDWDGRDFGTLSAKFKAGDEVILDGPATVPGGSALGNLDVLLRHLGDHCGGLQVGQVVITGSLCGLPYFGPGTAVSGEIDGLGQVGIRID